MRDWAKNQLGISQILVRLRELEQRADNTDGRLDALEHQVSSTLGHFGNYKSRTAEELRLIKSQLSDMIAMAESLVLAAEHSTAEEQRAKAILRKLKNNRTRAQNAEMRLVA